MNAKEFYLKETGWESLDQVEDFDTPQEVIGLMNKYAEHCEVPDREEEMREMLEECKNRLEYLNGRFPTGTTSNILSRLQKLLNK